MENIIPARLSCWLVPRMKVRPLYDARRPAWDKNLLVTPFP